MFRDVGVRWGSMGGVGVRGQCKGNRGYDI